MRLIQLDSQLAELVELFAECNRGNARLAIINGVMASGKTTLLHSLAEHAVAAGAVYAEATSSRAEQDLPLGVLDQLLRDGSLPADFAGCADRIRYDEPVRRSWINHLWGLLRELAERRPLVIAVDDAHYADRRSLDLLVYLFRRLKSARIMLVIARDVSLQRARAATVADPLLTVDGKQIGLPLLSPARVMCVLRRRLGELAADRLAAAFYEISGGNPLLLDALIRDHARDDSAQALAPGEAFRGAVVTCLRRTEPMICRVAQAVAVIGEPVAPTLLDEALGLEAGSSAHALNVLTAIGLVAEGRHPHEAARAAVLDEMSPTARATTHLSVAQMLFRQAAAPAKVAGHLLAADQVTGPSMVAVLQRAADLALAQGEVNSAIRYLRLAHRSCTDRRGRATITSQLARAEWRVDPSAAARHVPDLLDAAAAGLLDGKAMARLVLYLLWDGNVVEARAALRALLLPNAEGDVTPEVASTGGGTIWPWLLCVYPGILYGTPTAPQSAVSQEPISVILRSGQAALLMATLLSGSPDTVADPERIMGDSVVNDSAMAQMAMALISLACLGRHQEAASCCQVILDRVADGRLPTWRALFCGIYSMINLRLGRIAATREYADAALMAISQRSWGVAIGLPVGSLLLAATLTGDRQKVAECLNMDLPDQMFHTPCALHYLRARGQCYLMNESFDAALSDFQACGKLMIQWGLDLPSFLPWRTDAAEACLGLGMTQMARDLVDEQLARTGPDHWWTRGIALRVRAAVDEAAVGKVGAAGDTSGPNGESEENGAEDRIALLDEAVELLSRSGDRMELARAYADLSWAYHVRGDGRHARAMGREACTLASRCGVAPRRLRLPAFDGLAPEIVAAELATAPSGDLSDAELRVARLAALGYTNRRIAVELYITASTVEQHLTRIYRKLKVSSRSDLPVNLSLTVASTPLRSGR